MIKEGRTRPQCRYSTSWTAAICAGTHLD